MSRDLNDDRETVQNERYDDAACHVWRIGEATFDPGQLIITCNGRTEDVKPPQKAVLLWLVVFSPNVAGRDFLIDKAFGMDKGSDHSLNNVISSLRAMLGDAGRTLIKTISGEGYKLPAKPEPLPQFVPATDERAGSVGPEVDEKSHSIHARVESLEYYEQPSAARSSRLRLGAACAVALVLLAGAGYWSYSMPQSPSSLKPQTAIPDSTLRPQTYLPVPPRQSTEKTAKHAPADWLSRYVIARASAGGAESSRWSPLLEEIESTAGDHFQTAHTFLMLTRAGQNSKNLSPAYRYTLDAALVMASAASVRVLGGVDSTPSAKEIYHDARDGLDRLSSRDGAMGRRFFLTAAIGYWFFLRDEVEPWALANALARLRPEARELFGAQSAEFLAATGLDGITDLKAGRNQQAIEKLIAAYDGLAGLKKKSLWRPGRFAPALGQAALASGQCDQVMARLARADQSEQSVYDANRINAPWVETRFALARCALALGQDAKASALLTQLVGEPGTPVRSDVQRQAHALMAEAGLAG